MGICGTATYETVESCNEISGKVRTAGSADSSIQQLLHQQLRASRINAR